MKVHFIMVSLRPFKQFCQVPSNLFNRFKRLGNENVQQTFDRLTDISNELQALGGTDITDHEVEETVEIA